jgi:phosphoribosylformimino-5-aminoimidazole carboxamide ribonucleotide (ProFAR) isomerase
MLASAEKLKIAIDMIRNQQKVRKADSEHTAKVASFAEEYRSSTPETILYTGI